MVSEKGILIIEDDGLEFDRYTKIFKKYGWNVYPTKEEWRTKWKPCFNTRTGKINELVKDFIMSNYEVITNILLDVALYTDGQDDAGISEVLPEIRKNIKIKSYKYWGKHIPIIALTRYKHIKKANALTNPVHVDMYYIKDETDSKDLVLHSHSLYLTFIMRKYETKTDFTPYIVDKLDIIFDFLEESNEVYVARFDNIEATFRGNIQSIKDNLYSIIGLSLANSSKNVRELFLKEFINELNNDKQFKILEELYKRKGNIFESIKKSFRGGDFEELIKFIEEVFDEYNLHHIIPGGKIAIKALAAILKISR